MMGFCSESQFWVHKLFKVSSSFLKFIIVICLLSVSFLYHSDPNEIRKKHLDVSHSKSHPGCAPVGFHH